jgi:hypothetical protein
MLKNKPLFAAAIFEADGIVRSSEMSVFCGRGRVFVAEQCADNWQAQAVNNADRCKRMPQIM